MERSHAHAEGICHRTAHVWVVRMVDGKYQVLLQKRAEDKESFPGCFDTSSAGHIQAGDEPLESAMRELQEELGIHASPEQLNYAGKFHIMKWNFMGVLSRIMKPHSCFVIRSR